MCDVISGVIKTRRLAVSGAFHTALMEPAQEEFGRVLDTVKLQRGRMDVYSNYTGLPYNVIELRISVVYFALYVCMYLLGTSV